MREKTFALLACAAVAVGCSQEAPQPTPRAQSAAAPATAVASEQAIAQSAEKFMRAILAGDAPTAAELLTTKAAKRYAADRTVLPAMGMQVEQFAIGEVRLLNADEAAAQCLVTEGGTETAQELCCLLKREPAGWRVAGVAADSAEEAATVISFEGDAPTPVPSSRLVEDSPVRAPAARTAQGPTNQPVR